MTPEPALAPRRRVYIVYTGGTIGMRRGAAGYRPACGFLGEQMAAMPELRHPEMPLYTIHELDPLLDSSNMTPEDWVRIGRDIVEQYDAFDGFVVLHGTDTMAYSASALSFMLEGLAKPVVFTGSQIPLCEIRNDGRDNLITSLLLAAEQPVPEVCLCFGDRLLRGNRATKVSADDFQAFASPNYPRLGQVGVTISIQGSRLLPPPGEPLRFLPIGEPQVADVRLYPGMRPEMLRRFLQKPLGGAVLHTYGVGNAPDDPAFLKVLREATGRGVVIVNCTQCLEGSVDMDGYVTGGALREAGVISGYDMTPEAALTKLHWLLSQGLPKGEVERRMQLSLRGELTRLEG